MSDAPPTLLEQIAELKRELALRERVYPSMIARGKLRPDIAEKSMSRMKAALHTLMALQRDAPDV